VCAEGYQISFSDKENNLVKIFLVLQEQKKTPGTGFTQMHKQWYSRGYRDGFFDGQVAAALPSHHVNVQLKTDALRAMIHALPMREWSQLSNAEKNVYRSVRDFVHADGDAVQLMHALVSSMQEPKRSILTDRLSFG
jgi:hypothetical protein